jgi:wyosine [tRNA(Phe)-imidazoG37] synthetase (radical SAM superfamily)
MNARILRAADHLLPDQAMLAIRKAARGMRSGVAAGLAARHIGTALEEISAAFASFDPREGARALQYREIAILAVQLRGHARHDGRFFDALLAAAGSVEARLRPATLQSYVDVSVRTAAIRAFAGYVAGQRPSGGEAETLLAALAAHAPGDRAVLIAYAELLLDRARPAEAEPLLRRALRMNAVCQTTQRLLARIVGDDYDLSDKFCPMPFTHLSTSYKADAFTCCCSAWLPYAVGNVIEARSAEDVWNSGAAQEIRRSIHDGDFRYCSRTLCSYIAARTLPTKTEVEDPVLRGYIEERAVVVGERPDMVQMNHDPSCNLACPSCRTSVITAGPQEQRVYVDAAERVLLPLLRGMEGQAYISGGGEAFASAHYKKILRSLNRSEFPGLFVYLISNGQLLNEKRWAEFPDLPEMIGVLSVSIDAARAGTYEQLRRPGKWSVLMENLEVMARMHANGMIRMFQINFVVQAANFREIPEFIALGTRLGVDQVWLQRLTNYGAYEESVFEEADVTSPQHPDHEELLALLRPYVDHPLIDMAMLLPLLPEVVNVAASNPTLRVRPKPEANGLTPRKGWSTV